MKDLIERLRAKPEHERKRIAVATSVGATLIVAFAWLTSISTSGILALENDDGAPAGSQNNGGFSALVGAVAAIGSQSSENTLQIEDGNEASTINQAPAQDTRTVIPF